MMERLAEEIVDAVLEEIERSPEMDRAGLRRDRMVGKVAELIETRARGSGRASGADRRTEPGCE